MSEPLSRPHNKSSTDTLAHGIYKKSCNVMEDVSEYVASLSIGQTILRHTDKCLWIVEKCAEWSLSSTSTATNQLDTNDASPSTSQSSNKSIITLIRPLPWLFFLPILLILRIIRGCLNLGAIFLGLETIQGTNVIRFIQMLRREVRALKFIGLKRIRQKRIEKQQQQQLQRNKEVLTWREYLYELFMRLICYKPMMTLQNDTAERITTEDIQTQSTQTELKPRNECLQKDDATTKYDYLNWKDIEDDLELMRKLMQNDTNAAATLQSSEDEDDEEENDSMSEPEDDALSATRTTSPPPSSQSHVLKRLSSHSSLANEPIKEENEDTDSASANSEDESSQHIVMTDKKVAATTESDNANKNPINVADSGSGLTSDEYHTPQNSISVSPEPSTNKQQSKTDDIHHYSKSNNTNNNQLHECDRFIQAEMKRADNELSRNTDSKKSTEVTNNSHHHQHHDQVRQESKNASVMHASPRTHGNKKHKNRRRFTNLLRRKRK